MDSLSRLEMTLSDVAALARVQRPVVSMWRSRNAAGPLPFPAPVKTDRGRDVFSAVEIAAWLDATGRGNNPTAAADLSVFASPRSESRSDYSRFEALTALLVLRVLTGQPVGGVGTSELLDAADDADPDDSFLYTELERTAGTLAELGAYADSLADAAYNPAAAFETLMANRFRSCLRGLADIALTAPAVELVAGAAVELARQLGTDVFADSSRGGSDLLLGIAACCADPDRMTVRVGDDDGGASRLARRRLLVRGIPVTATPAGAGGSLAVEGPVVHVAQYPPAGWPEMGPEDVLTAVENTHLQMDDAQRAVVLAPARVLCGPLTGRRSSGGDPARQRADLLRGGRVRAIVQLPEGLLRSRPREKQALWVLGPSFAEVEIADRWTMVADLSGQQLTPDVVQDVIGDVAASMGDHATVRAHSFRFARLIPTRALLAAKSSLVAGADRSRSVQTSPGPAAAVRADELLRLLAGEDRGAAQGAGQPTGPAESGLPSGLTAAARTPHPSAPVHDLLAAGALTYLPGNRVAAGQLRGGNTRVLGPAELLDRAGSPEPTAFPERASFPEPAGIADPTRPPARSVDLLEFTSGYPGGRLTQPGDVVFCTSPRPAAVVDTQGGAVVVFPARILRISTRDPRGLHPDILAADINAQPSTAKDWRNWRLRTVPENQRRPLTGALAGIEHARRQAAQRLAWLNELDTLIRDGVAGGSLSLPVRTAPPEGTR